jgi:hypothetical protein
LEANGIDVSDSDAAEIFLSEFKKNFSIATDVRECIDANKFQESAFQPYSTELRVAEALVNCSASSSSPDGISFKLLKAISQFIIRPLNIIFQQSLYAGKFPTSWKHAVIIPIYKGKGDRKSPSSYRPISLCPCLGKLFEKVVQTQLTAYLKQNNLLNTAQHGFIAGRSTMTNILSCDAVIADAILSRHAYDIISFDFKAAFDKVTHLNVIEALAEKGVRKSALSWYATFLTGRTQQVKVGEALSGVCCVMSGVVQGSVCGPGLYTLVADSLLRKITLPKWGFADDFKIVADVTVHPCALVQAEINAVVEWSNSRHMPLSVEKCGVLHCGQNQPRHSYCILGSNMVEISAFKDLGIIRSARGHYEGQCLAATARGSKISGVIRRLFQQKLPELLWPAYQSYVLPVVTYGSSAWSPVLIKDIKLVEKVQRRLTKSIRGLHDMTYGERLSSLGVLSLQGQRKYTDMVIVFKALHGLFNCSANDLGLVQMKSSRRSGAVRLKQKKIISRMSSAMFSVRVPSEWNKLPINIRNCLTLPQFKDKLKSYLIECQALCVA